MDHVFERNAMLKEVGVFTATHCETVMAYL